MRLLLLLLFLLIFHFCFRFVAVYFSHVSLNCKLLLLRWQAQKVVLFRLFSGLFKRSLLRMRSGPRCSTARSHVWFTFGSKLRWLAWGCCHFCHTATHSKITHFFLNLFECALRCCNLLVIFVLTVERGPSFPYLFCMRARNENESELKSFNANCLISKYLSGKVFSLSDKMYKWVKEMVTCCWSLWEKYFMFQKSVFQHKEKNQIHGLGAWDSS